MAGQEYGGVGREAFIDGLHSLHSLSQLDSDVDQQRGKGQRWQRKVKRVECTELWSSLSRVVTRVMLTPAKNVVLD